jgi:hypothetical protein
MHPLSLFESRTSGEITEPATGDELIHFDSMPLCFSSFQIVRGNLGSILVENHSVNHEVLVEPMPQSSKALYDPIADMLDSLCFQSQVSCTPNDFNNCYDMDMIRQSSSTLCSTQVSFQSPSEKLQPCQEAHEDVNRINTNHGVELVKLECQEVGQVYLDPIDIYMKKKFIIG